MSDRFKPKGPSQRQQRVAELVRHALAEIVARGEIHAPELTKFYPSFQEVRMSPDLKLATVFVSALGQKDSAALLAVLNARQKILRHLVAEKINLRYAPDLRFRLDDTLDEVSRIETLLHSDKVRADLEKPADIELQDTEHED
ncbi:MAG: 30S ribosome-binding factor RbfA [Methylobacteriaceae bacterium]|nr:30S ribosome-binding factor RbfA [Methylobacteriaceae bacterium]